MRQLYWFIKYFRARTKSFPAERFAQLFPGVDRNLSTERFATRYRALNTGIAVLGLLLLGWLFRYMRRPDWDEGKVESLAGVYFIGQMLPLCLIAWVGVRYGKALKRSLSTGKRTAVLQRRGVFDFVSPFIVFLAVASYFLFAAFVIYTQQHPFPGFAGLINIGSVTLVYALNAFVMYRLLYGRNPLLERHADRLHTIGWTVKIGVYSCIAVVVFMSLNFTLVLLELKRWEPFALSVFLVIVTLLSSMGMTAPPREPHADGLTPTGDS
ncbi:MAG: hypothetical protein ACJ8R9_26930 [Steroidobacteraceae bacterium]